MNGFGVAPRDAPPARAEIVAFAVHRRRVEIADFADRRGQEIGVGHRLLLRGQAFTCALKSG